MSFPNLVITGDTSSYTYISDISLQYPNVNESSLPKDLIRSNYSVYKETGVRNVNQATPIRIPDIAYDIFRVVHKWTGYADVLTESVSGGTTAQADTNLALIRNAVVLETLEDVVTYQTKEFLDADRGPSNTSQGSNYFAAYDYSPTWAYGAIKGGSEYTLKTTSKWFIRGMQLSDNENNSTRFTMQLEVKTPWFDVSTTIDSLDL